MFEGSRCTIKVGRRLGAGTAKLKLIGAHATNYRNILDSNQVEIGQLTCLVGKNEAGKSAFLKALEGLWSTDSSFRQYNKITNYPRQNLAEYGKTHGDEEAVVMTATWRLEGADTKAVEAELGAGFVQSDVFKVYKTYEQGYTTWNIKVDETKCLAHLVANCGLSPEDKAVIGEARNTVRAYESLKALATRNTPQEMLFKQIAGFREHSALLHAIDMISKRMPKFMYFSHWDRMNGELSINKIRLDKQQGSEMSSGDRVFLDFLEYAGTTLDELVATTQFEELNARCEAAALKITNQIFDYWTQNDELKIKVVLSEGKQGDPAPFNAGPVARARVENNLHGVTVPFSERSAGFIWFFSFLVKFAQIKKNHGNVILLLDEPGLTLHGTAQLDLLRYFAEGDRAASPIDLDHSLSVHGTT